MFSFKQVGLVALGGLLGSVLRYLAGVYIANKTTGSHFPWGTFAVNITGSLVIGIIAGYSLRYPAYSTNWKLFLMTGFCGGFTTFSAFSNESYLLLRQHNYTVLLLYVTVSFVVSILATAAGYWLSR